LTESTEKEPSEDLPREEAVAQADIEEERSLEMDSESDDDIDSAFQSVTDVLEKQLQAEELLLKQQQESKCAEEVIAPVQEKEPAVQEVQPVLEMQPVQEEQPVLEEPPVQDEQRHTILRQLEMKRALHEKQRLEIERLQQEQKELEMALQKFELEVCIHFILVNLMDFFK